jgi:hypothetical protein
VAGVGDHGGARQIFGQQRSDRLEGDRRLGPEDELLSNPLLQGLVARDAQQSRLVPRRLRHEVVHRLMSSRDAAWIELRRHRLDALAFARKQESRRVRPQRLAAIRVSEHRVEPLQTGLESFPRSACLFPQAGGVASQQGSVDS